LRNPLITVLLVLLAAWMAYPARAQENPKEYAILVVGDTKNDILTQREKEIFKALQDWRARAGLTRSDLPIISYHMDRSVEANYCQKQLKIKPADVLFVGIVEHKNNVAQKVRVRVHNVVNIDEASKKVMIGVLKLMGRDLAVITGDDASPSPAVTPTPLPSPTPPPRVRGISLLRVSTVDYDGNPRGNFTADDRGVYVNVYFRNDLPTEEQRHLLSVRCLDPGGRPYGRTMGGPFSIALGEKIDSVDMVRRSDPERHNGFLIKGNQIGSSPGTYVIVVEVDGQVLGRGQFELKNSP